MFIMKFLKLSALFVLLIFSSCSTPKSYINMRTAPDTFYPNENTKQIYVRSIQDSRIFEDNPVRKYKDYIQTPPNIPSISGGVKNTSEDIRVRVIGRKFGINLRNIGDFLLIDGQSVNTIIYDTLVKAFNKLGYSVTNKNEEVKQDAYILDVTINKCWSWAGFGVWIDELNSEIATELHMKLLDKNIDRNIEVTASNKSSKSAPTGHYQAVIQLALNRYQVKVEEEFSTITVSP